MLSFKKVFKGDAINLSISERSENDLIEFAMIDYLYKVLNMNELLASKEFNSFFSLSFIDPLSDFDYFSTDNAR